MSRINIRHGKLDIELDAGDPITVTRNGVTRHGRVITSSGGTTVISFEPDPDPFRSVIGPEPVVWTADEEEPPMMSPAPEGARWSFGLVPPVARGRTGSITSQTVRVEDEGRCNACSGGIYETVTLVELRSIAFRLCNECRKTLVEQLASEEPDELDQVHERGYQMGYADAVIDAAAGGPDREILDAESRRRAGEASVDMLKAPRLVDGRVMRGDVEVEPKCPICGTGITCPCGVGIGT